MMPGSVTRGWVEDRLDTMYPVHVAALVRLLTELRVLFDGDLDAMLVLATTSISLDGDGWREALFDGEPLKARNNPTNTQSIAHVTQIPRETVRRKLKWLESQGWVTRDSRGNWSPGGTASTDLQQGTEATLTYLKAILNAAQKAQPPARGEGHG